MLMPLPAMLEGGREGGRSSSGGSEGDLVMQVRKALIDIVNDVGIC